MSYLDDDFGLLVGKTLKKMDITDDEVLFICDDETAFRAYHMQDCCESVAIHDIKGDTDSLIGTKIIESEDIVSNEWLEDVPTPDYLDSFTWTIHRIKTESGVEVLFRWLGESNGYYSESVYLQRTHIPI